MVADEDGTRANTWVHDDRGRLVRVTDSDGRSQRSGWDRWGTTRSWWWNATAAALRVSLTTGVVSPWSRAPPARVLSPCGTSGTGSPRSGSRPPPGRAGREGPGTPRAGTP
ncbi:hypothetical protein JJJ15_08395 [Actinomyces sp. HMT897]|nr:hypothetical protein JJJ15_08395 [Actinomyces sp. HMT897]